jgi:hypothetical protein
MARRGSNPSDVAAIDPRDKTLMSAVRRKSTWLATPTRLASTAVGIVALAFWVPYSFRAGFVYDDLATVASHRFHLSLFTSYRPGFLVWVWIVVRIFHTDPLGYYLLLAALMGVMGIASVLALTELGLPAVAAAGVGLLLVVSPYADSLGLWWTASQMSLSMILGLAGVTAGARWINGRPYAAVNMGASLALLVAAIVTYEAVAPIVLLPLALITLSNHRRRVLKWSVPAFITAAVAAFVMFERAVSPHHKTARPLGQYLDRIGTLISSGTSTLLHRLVGVFTWWDLLVACLVGGACYGGWRLTKRRPPGIEAGLSWIGASIVMLIIATYAAWIPFIPANDYYVPSQFGVGNRVNLLAQLFFLTGVVVLLVGLAKAMSRRTIATPIAFILIVGLFAGLFASFFSQTHQDQNDYAFATSQRHRIIAEVKKLLPRVADHHEIILTGYHLTASPQWVPVLAADWDTTGALELLYGNRTITGQPVSSALGCAADGMTQAPLELVTLVPYRDVIIVDLSKHMVEPMADRSQCRHELATLTVNPNPILTS